MCSIHEYENYIIGLNTLNGYIIVCMCNARVFDIRLKHNL